MCNEREKGIFLTSKKYFHPGVTLTCGNFRRETRHHSCICAHQQVTLAALPGSAASHASFMALISSCLSVSFFTSISSYETEKTSLANSYENLHDKNCFVVTNISKFIRCRCAFAELFNWLNEVVQRALANHKRRKKKHVFFQSIRNKKTLLSMFSRAYTGCRISLIRPVPVALMAGSDWLVTL